MIVSPSIKPDNGSAVTVEQIKVVIGLEEIHVSRDPRVLLACLGLGSCIAVSGYDPVARVGAMAHIVLPDSGGKNKEGAPGKYADTGIPSMVEQMKEAGALKSRIVIKIAGGARMFCNVKEGSLLDVGCRNLAAVKQVISDNRLNLKGENTGGSYGRSLLLYISSGLTLVTSAMRENIEL
jgi:chemotaxis protein CheD